METSGLRKTEASNIERYLSSTNIFDEIIVEKRFCRSRHPSGHICSVTHSVTLDWKTFTQSVGSNVQCSIRELCGFIWFYRQNGYAEIKPSTPKKYKIYGHQGRGRDSLTQINREESCTPVLSDTPTRLPGSTSSQTK